MYMSDDWQSLLLAFNQKHPLQKQLSMKGNLRAYQDLPTAYLTDATNNNLKQVDNARFTDKMLRDSGEASTAKNEMDHYLKGPFKGVGLTIIAAGAYGIACRLPPGHGDFLGAMWQKAVIKIGDPRASMESSEDLVVKFVRIYDKRGLEDTLRETRLHAFVSQSRVHGKPGYFPNIEGDVIVPKLHYANLVQIEGKWWFTTVMAVANGQPLSKYLQQKPLTARVFVAVEKAIYSMWLVGVAHGDFHPGNVMYDARTGTATVIDLGFAVKLPDDIVKKLRETSSVAADPADMYEKFVARYVSTIVYQRGGSHQYQFFNPDGRVLRFLYNGITDKSQLAAARLHAWTSLTLQQAKQQIRNEIARTGLISAFYPDNMNID